MKILLVSAIPVEYNTSHNLLNRALIKGFQIHGHEVSVVSMRPQEAASLYETGIKIDFAHRYYIDMRKVHSKLTVKSSQNSIVLLIKKALYRVRKKSSVYDSRSRYANEAGQINLTDSFDLMISSSDPKSSHLFAEKLLANNRARIKKWIQYWGDPFSLDINVTSQSRRTKAKHEEQRLLSLADKVIYVSPFTLNSITEKFPEVAGKCYWLPPPYEFPREYPDTGNKQKVFLYAGNYFKNDRDLVPLIRAFREFNDGKLILVGDTDIVVQKSDNVFAKSRVTFDEIIQIESESDVLVCVLNRYGTQIPAKLFQYAGTNREVLVCFEDERMLELKSILDERYTFVKNDAREIIKAICELKKRELTGLRAIDEFSAEIVSRKFLEITQQ